MKYRVQEKDSQVREGLWERIKNKHFNKEEFRTMLEKTSEWSLISSIEKDAIMESLDNSAVKKIIQITLAVNQWI